MGTGFSFIRASEVNLEEYLFDTRATTLLWRVGRPRAGAEESMDSGEILVPETRKEMCFRNVDSGGDASLVAGCSG